MPKKSKVQTPDWILKGYDSEADYLEATGKKKKGRTFKIRECPKCGSGDVEVKIGEVGIWECKKCKWQGEDIVEKELTEEEFMRYLDERGEEIA